jgi:dephospho-CoA kinase
MAVILFILGLPGSGKSTVFRHIENYVIQQHAKTISRINDYDILLHIYQNDNEKKFRPTKKYEGFDIIDFSVLDDALQKIHDDADKLIKSLPNTHLVAIEFARADYKLAFNHFNYSFLQDSFFLFLDVDILICKQRVRNRVIHPKTIDDHFISGHIFNSYYSKDSKQYIFSNLKQDYQLDDNKIKIFDNNGPEDDFIEPINQFIDLVLKSRNTNSNGNNIA